MSNQVTHSRGRILVSPRSFTKDPPPALDRLKDEGYETLLTPAGRMPTQEELFRLLPGCIGYIAGVEPIGGDLLRAATGLRAISRNGTGIDNIDLKAAEERGIAVLRASGANARGVAELTWGLVISLARSIPASDAALKAPGWERHLGLELENRQLGVVGCGTIGRMVAQFGDAFGMHVTAYDPYPDETFSPGSTFSYGPLESVISTSDVICLHCPPPHGEPLITRARIESMKPGALLVNTARADLVDDSAIVNALDAGKLGGYAADVFQTEPPGDDPLARHPKVIATPHVGAFTRESTDRVVEMTINQLLSALQK